MAAQSTAGARHPVSIGHLVMGVALLGLGVVWGLIEGWAVEGDDIRFLLPAPWILAGVAGLAALVTSDRRALAAQRRTATAPHPAPHPAPGTVEE